MAGQGADLLPGKDATLRGGGGDPGTGGFPVEAVGRHLQEAKGLGIWAVGLWTWGPGVPEISFLL